MQINDIDNHFFQEFYKFQNTIISKVATKSLYQLAGTGSHVIEVIPSVDLEISTLNKQCSLNKTVITTLISLSIALTSSL